MALLITSGVSKAVPNRLVFVTGIDTFRLGTNRVLVKSNVFVTGIATLTSGVSKAVPNKLVFVTGIDTFRLGTN